MEESVPGPNNAEETRPASQSEGEETQSSKKRDPTLRTKPFFGEVDLEHANEEVDASSERSYSPPRRRYRPRQVVNLPPAVYFRETVDEEDHLYIMSPAVISLFKEVVKFYPSVIFRKGSIELVYPYSPLYFHFSEMQAMAFGEKPLKDNDMIDFKVFEAFYDKTVSNYYQDLRYTLANDKSVSFEDVWALYKPGDHVVIEDNLHQKIVLVFTDVEKKRNNQRDFRRPFTSYIIQAWCMVWNPSEKLFQRRSWNLRISRYPGKRLIITLPVYPLAAVPETERKTLIAQLKERGARWSSMICSPAQTFMHDGPAFKSIARDEDQRSNRYRSDGREGTINLIGRVIVEEQRLIALSSMSSALKLHSKDHTVAGLDDRQEFKDWDDIPTNDNFSEEQTLLCPPAIAAFDTITAKWYVVAIENLKPVKWNTAAMNHLVLAKSRKELLHAVIEQHSKKKIGDLIQGKGIGVVILLHGPSGVGKTLTAESVAESTKRPLIPMSIQALISDGRRFESNLNEIFTSARRWNAILLLDEADIVLEARSFEDIGRNGIVSVFLRQLEYYGGILFLTTNRISTMDDAFQSRIQIAFEYKSLDRTTRRQIWANLIASDAIEIAEDARDSIEYALDKLAGLDLNGRQIRNTLNMAESLANADFATPGQLQKEHIEKAADATLKFKKMFSDAKKTAKGNARTVWAPYGSTGEDSIEPAARQRSWDLS